MFGQQPKPRITSEEWKKVRSNLYGLHHFTTKEIETIEGIFRGDMNEEKYLEKGIDTEELIKGIQYMRQHVNIHHISLEKINALELETMKYIAKSS